MTAPAITLTITQRERIKTLAIEERQVVTPGRVMLMKGRKIVGFLDLDQLGQYGLEHRCNAIGLSPADYGDVKQWLSGETR